MVGGQADGQPLFQFCLPGGVGIFEEGDGFAAKDEVNGWLWVAGEVDYDAGGFAWIAHWDELTRLEECCSFSDGFFVVSDVWGIGHGGACPVGAEAAWFYTGDEDAEWGYFFGKGFAEASEAEFGSLVDAEACVADAATDRADLKDATGTLLPHVWQDGAGYFDGCVEIGVQLGAHLLICKCFCGADDAKAGIVDQYIDFAKEGDGLCDCVVNLFFVGNVQLNGQELGGVLIFQFF